MDIDTLLASATTTDPHSNAQASPHILEGARRTIYDIPFGPTETVFAYASLADCGVLIENRQLATLLDFESSNETPASCHRRDRAMLMGRLIEVTPLELARLDSFAEHLGDYHRFQTHTLSVRTGKEQKAWVFQLCKDAGPEEQHASVCPDLFDTPVNSLHL